MKPKVLLITTTTAYPLYSGGALAQYYFIDGLKDRVDMSFCTVVKTDNDYNNLQLLMKTQPSLKVFYSDERRKRKKNFLNVVKCKTLGLLNAFQHSDKSIFTEPDDFSDTYFSHIDHAYSKAFVDLVNDVIVKEKIDIVQFDFYDTIDMVFALPDNVKKVFIHHEVRSKRLRLAKDKSLISNAFKNFLIAKTDVFEKACLPFMDVVGVFNEDDANELRAFCKKIVVTPFAIPDEQIYDLPESKTFDRLFFVGGECHTPNALGLKWFLDDIYIPNYDKIKLPLLIIGNWSESFKTKYTNCPGVVFCGVVDSMKPYFEHSIFVNPILTGAGLRTKVLHAFANSVPVLSTRFGAEGCYDAENNAHLGLFDSAEEFVNLLQNTEYSSLAKKGYDYYNSKFNKEVLLNKRMEMY